MPIRKATISDVDALQELYLNHLHPTQTQELDGDESRAARYRLMGELVSDPHYFILVSECAEQVVASVTLVIIKNLTHNQQPYALIENVVTHAAYRRQGVAFDLMAEAVRIAAAHRCYKVMLMTGRNSTEVNNFYEHCGFNPRDKTAFIRWLDIPD